MRICEYGLHYRLRTHIAHLYFSRVVRLYGIPRSIVSDMDTKFLSSFWETLWRFLGIKFMFNTSYYPQTNRSTNIRNHSKDTNYKEHQGL